MDETAKTTASENEVLDEDLSEEDLDAAVIEALEGDDAEEKKDVEVQAEPEPQKGAEEAPAEAKEAAEPEKKEEAQPPAEAEEAAAKAPEGEEGKAEAPAPQPSEGEAGPAASPEALAKQFREARAEAEKLLAEQHYKLSEEDAEALEVDPGAAIPRLMAKVYMDAVTTAISHVLDNMPRLIEGTMQVQQQAKAAEDKFYETWPQLDRSKHHEMVLRLGRAYRQAYPNASQDEFIRDVGAQALVALRIPLQAQKAPESKPFRPASVASAPAAQTVERPKNPFEALAEELMRDDM